MRLLVVLTALVVSGCVAAFAAFTAGAQAAGTSDMFNEVNVPEVGAFAGCAEFVDWSGSFHIRSHVVVDNTGGLHVQQFVVNSQDVTGTGETSGALYHFVGVQGAGSFTLTQASGASEITGVTRMRMVGPGPENNTFLDIHVHATLAATGEITVSFFDFALSCSNG